MTKDTTGITSPFINGLSRIEAAGINCIRFVYTRQEHIKPPTILCSYNENKKEALPFTVQNDDGTIVFVTDTARLAVDGNSGRLTLYTEEGKMLFAAECTALSEKQVYVHKTDEGGPVVNRVKTVDGERNFISNLHAVPDRTAYTAAVSFTLADGESIHGLGQGETGIYDYRGKTQYLYQHNMRIPMPCIVSSAGYGIFFDCPSLMAFRSTQTAAEINLDTVEQLDMYFITGNADRIVAGFRYLTGRAVMLPKWAFGYIQSRETYTTGAELENIVARYRGLHIPLDCVVQDWKTWEPGNWGQKTVDKNRYPDLPATMTHIHTMHAHALVSVWPNMNPGCADHKELFDADCLLNDYSTYNAFDEKARKIYFEQVYKELLSSGFDGLWCDSTEPFSGPDWSGETKRDEEKRFDLVGGEHKKYIDPAEANIFSLVHAQGIYENWRGRIRNKRVMNLTRSGYAGSQRYGTVLWSGDICARWDVLKAQIAEGLNVAMSGLPFWTLDIGGFFVVNTAWQKRGCDCSTNPAPLWFWNGGYNNGVQDPAYRELYVRWMQFGVFLPVFRSHGTDTPREIWNFGKEGEEFYDAVAAAIRLRYALMPYIYSLAGNVWLNSGTIMRSLLFDFADDIKARSIYDEYMFGPGLLVCPVTEAQYYSTDSKPIEGRKGITCYLPEGADWYAFFIPDNADGAGPQSTPIPGGSTVYCDTPLNRIPVFARAGSVIPVVHGLEYTSQEQDAPVMIMIYPGKDARFTLYEDAGDGYGYEQGEYSLIEFSWNDASRMLTIGNRRGAWQGMKKERQFVICCAQERTTVTYSGSVLSVTAAVSSSQDDR
jgi:alpha-D-xyloside xylohydrolase